MKKKPEKSFTDLRGYSWVILLLVLFSAKTIFGQKHAIDSLKNIISIPANDTVYINALNNLAYAYLFIKPDSCYYYANQALVLSQKNNYPEGVILSQENIAFTHTITGNYARSLELLLDALKSSDRIGFTKGKELAFFALGALYIFKGDHLKAIEYTQIGIKEARLLNDDYWISNGMFNIGVSYFNLNKLDSGFYWAGLAYQQYSLINDRPGIARSLSLLGTIHYEEAIYDSALYYSKQAIAILLQESDDYGLVPAYRVRAEIFLAVKNYDSAFYYAMQSLHTARRINFIAGELSASQFLVDYYKSKNNPDSVLKYLELNMALKDSSFSQEKNKDFQNLTTQESLRQQQIQQAKNQAQEEYATKFKIYGLLAGLSIFIIVALFQFRYARQQKSSGKKIKKAYDDLKSAQSQLIQSEKMASLGQLTAGIAHEIQNPLNFVNNFSEVNTELLQEMNSEIDKGNLDEVKIIARDLQDNEAKINYHGKRADSIVKGMLQHSRSDNGRKEMTDINSLANEYLQLAYRGIRAKNNSFTVNLRTDFDDSIGKINIVPQDIGRILLNLYNNAFYAVNEKLKQPGNGDEPTVSVSTKRTEDKPGSYRVAIRVTDNGSGIPQNIIDKIFQPFFTTKPTGQGTGLGLSLAYDIVKAHGGEIRAESKKDEGSTFTIIL